MQSPLNADHIILEIETLKQQNRYPEAREKALQALMNHTDDYRLYEELADISLFEKNLEKAEEAIRYARELHPESGTGIYLEGYILVEKGDFENAIEVLNEANKRFPNNPEILRNMGWSYTMKGDLSRGITLLKRAKTLDPDDPEINHDLNTALIIQETNISH